MNELRKLLISIFTGATAKGLPGRGPVACTKSWAPIPAVQSKLTNRAYGYMFLHPIAAVIGSAAYGCVSIPYSSRNQLCSLQTYFYILQ